LRQLVVGATDLEGKHRLQVFALEQHLVAQPLGQLTSAVQRGFHGHVVDARGEDFLDVLIEQIAMDPCFSVHRVHRVGLVETAAMIRRGEKTAREGRMMIMSDSWFEVWGPGDREKKPASRAGSVQTSANPP
jgi:hypothetical protein